MKKIIAILMCLFFLAGCEKKGLALQNKNNVQQIWNTLLLSFSLYL